MRTTLNIASALLLTAVAACAITIPTDPNTFSVEPAATSHLRGPQTVALANIYKSETLVGIGRGRSDLRELTNTAIVMLGRALEKQGIRVAPQAEKTITLRVAYVRVLAYGVMIAPRMEASLSLEVTYPDGTSTTIDAYNTAPFSESRAIDGAVLFAVIDLLRHEKFIAYINDDRPTQTDPKVSPK
jgi:hypothetical protein